VYNDEREAQGGSFCQVYAMRETPIPQSALELTPPALYFLTLALVFFSVWIDNLIPLTMLLI
jgi:hypothetical protein